jgi:protein-S-isoprenylcysteine O-methyltransferase
MSKFLRGTVTWLVIMLILISGWGWDDLKGFAGEWPRLLLPVAWLTLSLYGVCANTRTSGSPGKNEIRRHRQVFFAILPLLIAWFIYLPYADRHRLESSSSPVFRWMGLLVFTASYWLRIESIRAQGGQFSYAVAIQQKHRLTTGGPYRWMRHPAYTGVIGIVFGLSLIFAHVPLAVAMSALVWLWMETRIWDEEKLLLAEFGRDYSQYIQKTRKLIPFVY